jgi:hypothetical protein
MEKVQKILGCARTSLGSLSESARVFEPQLLLGTIGELAEELKPIGRDPRLAEIKHVIRLVDGSLLKALPRLTEAMWLTTRTGTLHAAWRLHAHFDLDKYVPTHADLTNPSNSGDRLGQRSGVLQPFEPTRQPRREIAGQRPTVEKTGVLIQAELPPRNSRPFCCAHRFEFPYH